ncbi:MAG: pyruvate dehydrogenase (acetyl-transferring) E1 component subunit alpha [Actinobacteria bacterium]|nr:pyruvate dehydrogenase (acetyl-transferring) E1 component subunit alpha [Actinomycetota bacterium]
MSEGSSPYRIVAPDGTANERAVDGLDLKEEDLRELYRLMALARRADLEATALQRQGELAVYPPLIGQEAAQVGSAFALGHDDFIFPSYRELAAAIVRKIDLVEYLHFYRATWHGGVYDPYEHHFGMVSVPVGSQPLHAVGYALGKRMDGERAIVLTYFGDGATSEGDVHEAMNFAAVMRAPVVFFCQNNGWAISVPLEQQTLVPIFQKAQAYGFPGVQVDGNDVLAVYQVTREAASRAREDHQPTLIEALTYRMGPHSTADDAGKYRTEAQLEPWRKQDPLERYERFLSNTGVLTDDVRTSVQSDADALAAHIRAGIVGLPPRPVEELFEWVFETPTETLRRQRDEVLELAEEDD